MIPNNGFQQPPNPYQNPAYPQNTIYSQSNQFLYNQKQPIPLNYNKNQGNMNPNIDPKFSQTNPFANYQMLGKTN